MTFFVFVFILDRNKIFVGIIFPSNSHKPFFAINDEFEGIMCLYDQIGSYPTPFRHI
jgi:hypothetical protein